MSSCSGRTVVPNCFRLACPTACSSSRRLSWKRSEAARSTPDVAAVISGPMPSPGKTTICMAIPCHCGLGGIIRRGVATAPDLRAYTACKHKPVEAAPAVVHAGDHRSHAAGAKRKAMTITLPAAAREPDHPVADGLPAERRRWAIAAIFTALAMASLDTAIANIALPAIAADLHVSPEQSVW